MNPRARQARYGFIGLGIVIGRFVGDQALHLQAGIGAAIEEWYHQGRQPYQRWSDQGSEPNRCLGAIRFGHWPPAVGYVPPLAE
jgi:hypothetical protein